MDIVLETNDEDIRRDITITRDNESNWETILSQPYGPSSFRSAWEKHHEASQILANKLTSEFRTLLQFDDSIVIRKAALCVVIAKSQPGLIPKDAAIDFSQLPDPRQFELQVITLALRIFGNGKHHLSSGQKQSTQMDVDLATLALKDKNAVYDSVAIDKIAWGHMLQPKDFNQYNLLEDLKERWAQGEVGDAPYEWHKAAFDVLVKEICSKAGVSSYEFVGPVYKPLDSLFNKLFVRRGQTAVNIVGDAIRSTLLVDHEDDVEKITSMIEEVCSRNFKPKLKDFTGSLPELLERIHDMDPLTLKMPNFTSGEMLEAYLSGRDVRFLIYRSKPNSSQMDRIKNGLKPHLVNVNFFIDHPHVHLANPDSSYLLAACEIQIGVKETVDGLRQDHTPYERARLLDGLPSIKHVLDGSPPHPSIAYSLVKSAMINHCRKKISKFHYLSDDKNSDPTSWTSGGEPDLLCANNDVLNFNTIASKEDGASEGYSNKVQLLWEGAVDADVAYVLEEVSVRINDQGWGNTSINIQLHAQVGPYTLEIASRFLDVGERELDSIHLVLDGYNFSRFVHHSCLPLGTTKLLLIAVGWLGRSEGEGFRMNGHTFEYHGLSIKLGELLID
eukprot:CAMPEP_0185725672 /NCGR_PEP_ID=MMETSP1171-20130828/1877_1 /TAXON_ID=374046 /ORGANISM="Helicotheca tamensis, Strain CCMP826" /LENGTH=615 /DNA_ID=CAMNT_0028393859 /DNA_START=86 /DNA_END=1933 /DNA_ORIENTATION=-